jgi:superfamily II DNA or RNA helicase
MDEAPPIGRDLRGFFKIGDPPSVGGAQKSHGGSVDLRPGAFVHSRGTQYRIRSVQHHSDCCAVSLAGGGGLGQPTESLVLLSPFDRLVPIVGQPGWRRLSNLGVTAAIAAASLEGSGRQRLGHVSPRSPALEILDWQLEASRLCLEGHATRILIADEVGLGKTIQAGHVHIALANDRSEDRTLIIVPSGLREQWVSELERLFCLQPTLVDAAYLRHIRRTLPPSVNPWGLPGVFITAIDFVKQPEVLSSLLAVQWTLVVLDEVHGLVGATDRHRAAEMIAGSAQVLLMLTATPHSGVPLAFEQLQRLGRTAQDRLAIIRRTRADVGRGCRRRVVTLNVRPTLAERRLDEALRAYLRRLSRERFMGPESAHLVAWVLMKRAASASHALLLTLRRRLAALVNGEASGSQAALPFGAGPGEWQEDDSWLPPAIGTPGLRDSQREAALLESLIAQADEVCRDDRKVAAAARLVRRAQQPVIVFTEFRDTLEHLVASLPAGGTVALHGGMDRRERRAAEYAFTAGQAHVLVATDAASEGLNLQTRCRFVINFDVPWNPARLEQRIGRVDRIGQTRPVHAVTLTTDAGGPILQRLHGKQDRIRQDLAQAASSLKPIDDSARPGARSGFADAETVVAAVHLLRARLRRRPHADGEPGPLLPWATVSRGMRRRMGLPTGVLAVFSVRAWTARGSHAATSHIPVLIELDPALVAQGAGRRLIESCVAIGTGVAARHAHTSLAAGVAAHLRRISAIRRRVAASLDREPRTAPPMQPGLFDRRAITIALEHRSRAERRLADLRATLARLDQDSHVEIVDEVRPIAAFVLR